jgi:hypothetical protein
LIEKTNLPAEECDVQRIAKVFRDYEAGIREKLAGIGFKIK